MPNAISEQDASAGLQIDRINLGSLLYDSCSVRDIVDCLDPNLSTCVSDADLGIRRGGHRGRRGRESHVSGKWVNGKVKG